jgi:amidase
MSMTATLPDAIEIAAQIRSGQRSALEVTEETIDWIERLNPVLNAVATKAYDEARVQAAGLVARSPIAGVPILVKDLITEVAGLRLTDGSRFAGEHRSRSDSEYVRRLRVAGAIFVGKANTSEFGAVSATEPERFGATLNPWDLSASCGGSSGGSAAAVAAGMVAVAHGNDGGGSLRIPASCCGVFALKPTPGRTPLPQAVDELFSGLVAEHVLTRTVRDSAAFLDATAGPDPASRQRSPAPPLRAYVDDVARDPGPLRIGLLDPAAFEAMTPVCREAAERAASICEQLGHRVVESMSLPVSFAAVEAVFSDLWADGICGMVKRWERIRGRAPKAGELEPISQILYERGRRRSVAEHADSVARARVVATAIRGLFERCEVVISPTLTAPPVARGELRAPPGDPLDVMMRDVAWAAPPMLANIAGSPAMSVPLVESDAKLPIGVQFLAAPADEHSLFALAGQLERAWPWRDRRPANCVR